MAKRFNPPPGWPQPPTGWTPPPGWKAPSHLPSAPAGWQFWVDDPEGSHTEAKPSSRPWRPTWQLYVAAGIVGVFALIGLVAGLAGVLILGGVAVLLAGVVGLIRPRWVGVPTRAVTGIASTAGFALLAAGVAVSPPAPVAEPPPVATSTAPSEAPSPPPTTTTSVPAHPAPTPTPTSTTLVPSTKPSATPRPSQQPPAGTALATLEELTVKGRAPKSGYSRDQFGSGWGTQPGGCDTRQTVLRRDIADVKILATDDCTVIGGKLNDPYTGAAVTAKTTTVDDLEADHIVAASDAWQKGAQQLTDDRREAFYNDLLNLQTTIGAVNASKGDGDAATWLPPNTKYRCTYVARQIAVKSKYDLWVTRAEKAAMTRVLTRCPNQKLPTAASARKVVDKKPTMVDPQPKPPPKSSPKAKTTDPRFPTCKAANAAGYGDYVRGKDPEYEWYRDNDHDGVVCEQ